MRALLALLVAAAVAATPAAQDPADNPFGHSRHGGAFDEGPRQAAYRMPGMSAQVHLAVAGLDAEAQTLFDQGLTQLHGFWYFEAERSFREVARRFPGCAMAYWGMAMANAENKARAAGFTAYAVQHGAAIPAREQMWIDALASYHQVDDACKAELRSGDAAKVKAAREALQKKNEQRDEQALGRKFVKGLEALVFAHSDDIEAKALLAIQYWHNYAWGSGIPIESHAAIDALLDQVFAVAPLHPAHHYRVHLWDREKAERALGSAAVIGHSAPGIAHQWHMGGHIFDKLDRHADAAWQQEASARVDHAHMMRDRVMPFLIHNYGHNQEWLCRSLQHTGRVHEALELARNMVASPRHPKLNRLTEGDEIAGYGRERLLQVCTTFELWPELRAACEDGTVDEVADIALDADRLLALGTACCRLGDAAAADRAMTALSALQDRARLQRADEIDRAELEAKEKKQNREDGEKSALAAFRKASRPLDTVRDAIAVLRAEQAMARGDGAAALAALPQDGVPPAVRARAHLLAGEPAKAVELLKTEQGKRKARVAPLAELILALHAAGQRDELAARFADLRKLAGAADLDTPLLRRLAPIVAELGLPADWRESQPVAADAGQRPSLDQLGPFRWSPVAAAGFDLAAVDGARIKLADRRRATLVVFHLGFACLHCAEQLKLLTPKAGEFAAAGIDVIAIGADPVATAASALAATPAPERLTFPLLCDPEFTAFRAWRCFDDFEQMPLHGAFLVDAEGRVRWQDIGAEPFMQIDWLLGECRRLLAMPHGGVGSK